MKTFKVKEKCPHCSGTGIYVGFAERNGFGVVCNYCNGTGCFEFEHQYEEFKSRGVRKGVVRIVEVNPGITIGTDGDYKITDFGGIDYDKWFETGKFPKGSEMRSFVCPAWWYQSTDYDKKPNWKECRLGGAFSRCKHFEAKEMCWKKFDKENS